MSEKEHGRASGRAVRIGLVATKPYGPSTAASALWACVGTGASYLANACLSVAKSDVYRAVPNGARAPLPLSTPGRGSLATAKIMEEPAGNFAATPLQLEASAVASAVRSYKSANRCSWPVSGTFADGSDIVRDR